MKVLISIKLGNDAMQTSAEVASALEDLRAHLARYCSDAAELLPRIPIRDQNGNTVGELNVVEDQ